MPSSVLSKGTRSAALSLGDGIDVGGGDVDVEAFGASSSEITSGVPGSCSSDSWRSDCVALVAASSVDAAIDVLAIRTP